MKYLEFKKDAPGVEKVIFKPNGIELGDLIRGVDGDYYFHPASQYGAWQGYVLMELSIHLALLNETKESQG